MDGTGASGTGEEGNRFLLRGWWPIVWGLLAVGLFYLVEDVRGHLAWKRHLRDHPRLAEAVDRGDETVPEKGESGRFADPEVYRSRKLTFPLTPFRRAGRWHPSAILGESGITERAAAIALLEEEAISPEVAALALLELGRSDEGCRSLGAAFQDWDGRVRRGGVAEANAVRDELMNGLQVVWQGIREGKWSPENLGEIRRWLEGFVFLESAEEGVAREASGAVGELHALRWDLRARRELSDALYPGETGRGGLAGVEESGKRAIILLMPNGWIDRNKVHLCREYGYVEMQRASRGFDPRTVVAERLFLRDYLRLDPRPGEVYLRCARVAVAAELFRIREGRYPVSLEEMGAGVRPGEVGDPFAPGTDLVWRLEKASPVVYSIGPNRRDDGGIPRAPVGSGDLVWRYRLPDGFSFDDYLVY